ncbi:MFS transporter [Piscirickettsia salmonis]|nr:MFS transporter [Piscirickettsia salmonis]
MLGFTSLLIAIQHSANYYWLILPLMAIGFGTAFTMPAATMVAIYSVPKGREGIASGYFTTGRQIGSLIGVVCFGAIISKSQQLINGMQISLAVFSLLFLRKRRYLGRYFAHPMMQNRRAKRDDYKPSAVRVTQRCVP